MLRSESRARALMWALALITALAAMRYFLIPPLWLEPPLPAAMKAQLDKPVDRAGRNVAPHAYAEHRLLFLTHIACGITALVIGLFQFIASLRNARPATHRILGMIYVSSTVVGGITGFPLSFYILHALPAEIQWQAYPAVAGFASLSVVWPVMSVLALIRARQRRMEEHRIWMIRSYSLTFAAVTVRLVGAVIVLLTMSTALSVNGAILSWPLNLVVAEWLIRRRRVKTAAVPEYARAS